MPGPGERRVVSDRELAQMLDLLAEQVVRYRVDDLTLTYCNRSWAAQFHADPEELIGTELTGWLHPEELVGLHAQLARLGPLMPFLRDGVARPASRMPGRWIEWADRYLPHPDGDEVLAIGRDVTQRHLAEQRLAESEARFRDLADRAGDVVWRFSQTPTPHLGYLSPSVESVTGWPREAFGSDLTHLHSILGPESRAAAAAILVGDAPSGLVDVRIRRPDDSWIVLELQVVQLEDGLQGVGRDVTEIRRLQADLSTLALRDPLTGLANRRLLDILLGAALARVARSEDVLVVTFVDLDDFKAVNDTHGHAAGDALLTEVAQRLVGTLRGTDVVARLGGDEFVVVHETAVESIGTASRRIVEALRPPYVLPDGTSLTCSASLGEADTRSHASAAALLAAADEEMYAAKRRHHGAVGR